MSHSDDFRAPSEQSETCDTGASWQTAFEQELLDSAKLETPPSDLTLRTLETISYRKRLHAVSTERHALSHLRVIAPAIAAIAALFVIVPRYFRSASNHAKIEVESVVPVVGASAKPQAAIVDPCLSPGRALGQDPLIDDFEDGNDTITPRDGRDGFWRWSRDTDAPGTAPALLSVPRADAKRGNQNALHVRGEKLREWGTSIELVFRPSCYDASAYAGIAFQARGPGRIYVALRQVDVIPVEFHGTCERDCFNAHVRKIDLDSRFREYEVRWSDVEQRGYGKPTLDATRLHDIAFQIRPEDTPYDVWLDTLRFIKK